jgi:hypothetical protein
MEMAAQHLARTVEAICAGIPFDSQRFYEIVALAASFRLKLLEAWNWKLDLLD